MFRLAGLCLLLCGGCVTGGTTLRLQLAAADTDADVFIDGNYVGQAGALVEPAGHPVRLAPGVHRLEVRKTGRFPVYETLRVDRRRSPPTTIVNVELLEDPL